ncbi:hypothetical protein ACJX0J_005719, partial [Zea mays]
CVHTNVTCFSAPEEGFILLATEVEARNRRLATLVQEVALFGCQALEIFLWDENNLFGCQALEIFLWDENNETLKKIGDVAPVEVALVRATTSPIFLVAWAGPQLIFDNLILGNHTIHFLRKKRIHISIFYSTMPS